MKKPRLIACWRLTKLTIKKKHYWCLEGQLVDSATKLIGTYHRSGPLEAFDLAACTAVTTDGQNYHLLAPSPMWSDALVR